MTKIHLTLAFIFTGLFSVSQIPAEQLDKELIKAKKEIDEQAVYIREGLNYRDDFISAFQKMVSVEFTVDTFKIERLCSRRMELDFSTAGTVHAISALNSDYDKLLNKYYKMLNVRLSTTDQAILKQSQRNWIAFRDSEIKLIGALRADKYSGGGTIQSIFHASYVLELTKKRVFEMVSYLYDMAE
jgi:uncharacterized protein YecT (DUF1311 family)